MLRKFILITLSLCLNMHANADDGSKISYYVDNLLKQSFSILKDSSESTDQKVLKSESLISANMDLPWMSKFVLGKYRRTLSPDQLAEFVILYSDYVVKSYGNAVKSYQDQGVKVVSQQAISPNEFIVKTQLTRAGSDPLSVDYMVRKFGDSKFKVFDVVTEGVSLINSHQAEFTNTISNQGFDSLITDIKGKLKTLETDGKYGSRED